MLNRRIMSIYTLDEITCICGEVYEAELMSAMNPSDDPEIKECILTGSVNLARCPKCKKTFYVERFFLYRDDLSEILAFVYPLSFQNRRQDYEKEMFENLKNLNQSENNLKINYEPILIFGIESLMEILKTERDRECEEEILELIQSVVVVDTIKIRPSLARKLNIPKLIPIKKNSSDINFENIISALYVLAAYNPHLVSYAALIEKLSNNPSLAVQIIEGKI
jgi:hypothetical protein